MTFERFVERGFGALAQYCATDMVAALGYLRALGEVSLGCEDAGRLKLVDSYVEKLMGLARGELAGFNLERVSLRAVELRRALAEPDHKRRLRDRRAWPDGPD